ncbi:hypothetical protein, partial [Streptomyces sp. SID10115]|uniref:hypothetical protein n=1 Tax=Streptomyces sp. SID10115 TaxID=2706016 RepID=UPI0019D2976D
MDGHASLRITLPNSGFGAALHRAGAFVVPAVRGALARHPRQQGLLGRLLTVRVDGRHGPAGYAPRAAVSSFPAAG